MTAFLEWITLTAVYTRRVTISIGCTRVRTITIGIINIVLLLPFVARRP